MKPKKRTSSLTQRQISRLLRRGVMKTGFAIHLTTEPKAAGSKTESIPRARGPAPDPALHRRSRRKR